MVLCKWDCCNEYAVSESGLITDGAVLTVYCYTKVQSMKFLGKNCSLLSNGDMQIIKTSSTSSAGGLIKAPKTMRTLYKSNNSELCVFCIKLC